MSTRISLLILALVVLAGCQRITSQSTGISNAFDLVDKTGNIRKPADFRLLYQALGVYTPVDLNNNTEMHYTYASRAQLGITARMERSRTDRRSIDTGARGQLQLFPRARKLKLFDL